VDPPDPKVAYEVIEVKDPIWLREHFRIDQADQGQATRDLVVRGLCRRCGHEVDKRLAAEQVRSFENEPAKPRAMKCNCGSDHAGRQSGQGCGAWWGLEVKPRS
jgi:hypothetical protein